MKIIDVETYVLLADNYDPSLTSSAQDTCLVIIKTDEGIEGYGECDTSPWVAKAFIESPGTHTMDQCVKEILIGSDPLEIDLLWEKIYIGTAMTGRRGAGVNAMSAIDMALWDIKGKALNKPVFELMGGKEQDFVIPYASLQPSLQHASSFSSQKVLDNLPRLLNRMVYSRIFSQPHTNW